MAPVRGSEHFPAGTGGAPFPLDVDVMERERLLQITNPRLESRSLAKQCSQDIPARFFIGSREHAIQRGTVEAKEQIIKGG